MFKNLVSAAVDAPRPAQWLPEAWFGISGPTPPRCGGRSADLLVTSLGDAASSAPPGGSGEALFEFKRPRL